MTTPTPDSSGTMTGPYVERTGWRSWPHTAPVSHGYGSAYGSAYGSPNANSGTGSGSRGTPLGFTGRQPESHGYGTPDGSAYGSPTGENGQ